jgi:hypothetical protein
MFQRNKADPGAPLYNAAVFSAIRQMLSNSDEFHYDGWQTAIRLVCASALTPEKLGSIYQRLISTGRDQSSVQVGMELIWVGAVSPEFISDADRYYLVVTLEGGLRASQLEFDQLVFGTSK